MPNKFHESTIYNNNKNLYEKIVWAIKNHKNLYMSNIKLFTQQYDWKNMAPIYDERLSLFSNKNILRH